MLFFVHLAFDRLAPRGADSGLNARGGEGTRERAIDFSPAAFSSPFALPSSPGTLVNLALIAVTLIATLFVHRQQGLHGFVPAIVWPVALLAVLVCLAAFYRRRREVSFVLCLSALAQIVAFATLYVMLMYGIATYARPLVDRELDAFDQACDVSVPAIWNWAQGHPTAAGLLRLAYDSLLPQTAIVIAVLGFTADRRRLETFLRAFMIAALLAVGMFLLLPAEGPFATHRLSASADQTRFLEHFHALRSGSRTLVSYHAAEGLIAFPSFHATWAILLTWAFHGRRRWFVAFAMLNSLVIVSTLTTGWHYFADIIGGGIVALIALFIADRGFRAAADTQGQRPKTQNPVPEP